MYKHGNHFILFPDPSIVLDYWLSKDDPALKANVVYMRIITQQHVVTVPLLESNNVRDCTDLLTELNIHYIKGSRHLS